jgi:hypothetical protein
VFRPIGEAGDVAVALVVVVGDHEDIVFAVAARARQVVGDGGDNISGHAIRIIF